MIAIVDYGMGNLRSVANAFAEIGVETTTTAHPEDLRDAQLIVVPGVGAFGDGMANLRQRGLLDALDEEVIGRGKPFLGICLGMQFLAEGSDELGEHAGLGWIPGRVTRIAPREPGFKVPHMGWNDVEIIREAPLFENLEEDPVFYFVHSYALKPSDESQDLISSTVCHGEPLVASVQKDNIYGVQFHPEKSQAPGIAVLRNVLREARVLAAV